MISIRGAWTRRVTSVLSALAALLFMAGIAASAQGIITGGINGTVTDQTGAVIPGAAVSVTNTATGAIVQAKSTGPPFGPTGSGAGGGAYPQGLGNRNVQLTGKITF